MGSIKKLSVQSLIKSMEGLHLTAYLKNRGDLEDLKYQLKFVLNEAEDQLSEPLNSFERKKFLEPLEGLLQGCSVFKKINGNIGIFRNEKIFRILNLPIELELSYQIASSFHVKPLLRWIQGDQDFILLGLGKDSADIYLGNQSDLNRLDTIVYSNFFNLNSKSSLTISLNKVIDNKMKESEVLVWLNDWLLKINKKSNPKLFLVGDPKFVKNLMDNITYRSLNKTLVANSYSKNSLKEICNDLRGFLKKETNQNLENIIKEFKFADRENKTTKNIFQISRAVFQGKVRKLIVTDQVNIFGKIDAKSGNLYIHPFDLDHEDDCLLDDLSQMVLTQGGEVAVVNRNEIPNGRPILAILDEDYEPETEKIGFDFLTNNKIKEVQI